MYSAIVNELLDENPQILKKIENLLLKLGIDVRVSKQFFVKNQKTIPKTIRGQKTDLLEAQLSTSTA